MPLTLLIIKYYKIMERTATFRANSTATVNTLKMQQGYKASDSVLEIIKNPDSGKFFFNLGTVRGAITSKLTPQELAATYAATPHLVCVSILDTEDGAIPVLHKRGDSNVVVSF